MTPWLWSFPAITRSNKGQYLRESSPDQACSQILLTWKFQEKFFYYTPWGERVRHHLTILFTTEVSSCFLQVQKINIYSSCWCEPWLSLLSVRQFVHTASKILSLMWCMKSHWSKYFVLLVCSSASPASMQGLHLSLLISPVTWLLTHGCCFFPFSGCCTMLQIPA